MQAQKTARKRLKLEEIRLDYRLQSRVNIDHAVVSDYCEAVKAGEKLPAVSVVFDKVYYYLVDGFHRFQATKAAGVGEIEVDSVDGHFRDALLASVGANSKHGLRRSNDDKRRAVMTLLDDEEWATWSSRDIAKACGVSHDFVARVKSSLSSDDSEKEVTYTTKHGTQAVMKTANIGSKREDLNGTGPESDSTSLSNKLAAVPAAPKVVTPQATVVEDDDGFDTNAELVRALEENQAMSVQIDALSVDDVSAQLLKEIRIRQGVEARLSQEMETNKRQDKELRWFGRQFEELRKILGVDTNSRVVAAVKALLHKEAA